MAAMTRLLLACSGVLPLALLPVKALACDASGATVWVNLQLAGPGQAVAEWPLVKGHFQSNTVCIEKRQLHPQLLPASSFSLYIEPATDLVFAIDNAQQGIRAQWHLDIYGVAGLPVISANGKDLQPSCVIQHLAFNGEPSTSAAANYQLDAQANMPVLGECQGVEQIKKSMPDMERQWTLNASFITTGIQNNVEKQSPEKPTETLTEQQVEKPEMKPEKPGVLEKFINLPSAGDDAKKRMKKR